jgi:hypothetical protein
MVDIADGAVANRYVSGYDPSCRAPDFERMIVFHLHAAADRKGTHP